MPGKGHVLRADHEGQEEVAEDARDGRDHEEEDHDHAVQREHAVVRHRVHDGRTGREQLEPQEQREDAAQEEPGQRQHQVDDADALVVERGQPRPDALLGVQVVRRVVDRATCR
jgi:hypothetical protein